MPLLDEYRERANEAARQAEAATSTGVRERHLQVEAAFRAGMKRVERSLARSAMLRDRAASQRTRFAAKADAQAT